MTWAGEYFKMPYVSHEKLLRGLLQEVLMLDEVSFIKVGAKLGEILKDAKHLPCKTQVDPQLGPYGFEVG